MDILMCREFIVRRAQYHGLGPERAQPYKKSSSSCTQYRE